MSASKEPVVLAIRVRGLPKVRPEIEDTLEKLKLNRLHMARVIKMTPSLRGMIQHAKDYITWGEIDEETATLLLSKRGRITGNRRLTDDYVRKNSGYKSIQAFAKALVKGDARTSDVQGLKPVFRLTPPAGGFKGIRRLPVTVGGITGYRGPNINELAKKMI
ncbi:MAG: 50S ribosomal protein L30 [Candidatus Thorarchaeota archaeon]